MDSLHHSSLESPSSSARTLQHKPASEHVVLPAPIDDPYIQELKHNIRSMLDLVTEPTTRRTLRDITTTIIRLTLRLLPREGSLESQRKHIEDGTARKLLLALRATSLQLLTMVQNHLEDTREPLETAFTLQAYRARGYRAMLGNWCDLVNGLGLPSGATAKTIRMSAELFDMAVWHPAVTNFEHSSQHPISQLFDLFTEISLDLNEAARLSRAADTQIRAIFHTMNVSTSPRERALIFQSSVSSRPGSFGSVSDLVLPSPVDLDPTRSMSFSGGVSVPDPIEEPRCSDYSKSGHECELEGCISSSTLTLDSSALISEPDTIQHTSLDTNEEAIDDSDGPLMMASPSSFRDVPAPLHIPNKQHQRIHSLQRQVSESPLEMKHRRLHRVFSLPTGSLLGSAPLRKRRVTTGAQSGQEKDTETGLHTPSKSLPAPGKTDKPYRPERGDTI